VYGQILLVPAMRHYGIVFRRVDLDNFAIEEHGQQSSRA